MSTPRRISLSPRSCPRRSGFALLITVILLAFLVLLLVSLASLTRVETQVASNSQTLAQARQNALFGLDVALGRLQKLAGPDQRVTATADLVENRDDSKQHWTGVWNADPSASSYGKNIGWLVSGMTDTEDADVSGGVSPVPEGSVVTLLGEKTVGAALASDQVSVSTEPIKSAGIPGLSGTQTIGQFAYWVGDEGVKANVALSDPWAGSADAARQRYAFVNMQRSGVELVQADADALIDNAYPANAAGLSRLLSLRQFPLLAPAGSTGAGRLASAALNRYHDLTARSSSVLADVARGGLKKDLSNWLSHGAPSGAVEQDAAPIISTSEGADYGLPHWGLLRSYASLTDGGAPLAPRVQTDQQQGLFPVVTYFNLGIAVSCEGADKPLRIHLFPTLVLWNPCNVPIANIDAGGDPVRYEIDFSVRGASSRLRFRVGDSTGPEKALLSMNKADIGDTGAADQYFRFEVAPDAPIPPGQSLVFTLAGDADYNPGQNQLVNAADSGSSVVLLGDNLSASDLAAGLVRTSVIGNTMDVVLRIKPSPSEPAPPANYPLLPGAFQTIQRVGFGNIEEQTINPVPADPPIAPQMRFSVTACMSSLGNRGARWIASQNPRARFAPRAVNIDGSSYHSAYVGGFTPSLSTSSIPLPPSFAESGTRASAGVKVLDSTATDLVLAEFQSQGAPLFSLAQFQHANLSAVIHYPAYAVGNSLAPPFIALGATQVSDLGNYAGDYTAFHDVSYLLNRDLWDRYYFSTVPATLTDADLVSPGYHLPNARYRFDRSATAALLNSQSAFDTAAACLRLDGGFNVNSTSVQAWRALLAGHRDLEVSGNFRHPYSRFTAPVGTLNAPFGGHRVLTDDQIESLAEKIRGEVLARGPFLSLADFVNRRLVSRGRDTTDAQRYKGALQAAIDAADTDTAPSAAPINTDAIFKANLVPASLPDSGSSYIQKQLQGGEDRKAPYSSRSAFAPGYLTQADLLTAIGPALTARSDTFVIRAYGEACNPATGATDGKAWCEAVVQRSTRYVEDSVDPWTSPASGSASDRFGRRFEIVSFRWLGASDR